MRYDLTGPTRAGLASFMWFSLSTEERQIVKYLRSAGPRPKLALLALIHRPTIQFYPTEAVLDHEAGHASIVLEECLQLLIKDGYIKRVR